MNLDYLERGCKEVIESKVVKKIIKLVICFSVVILLMLIFFQKTVNHSTYLKKFEESALVKASEKYGEGCTVLGRRYNPSNKSCNVGIINKDETLIIVYEVKYYSHDKGEEIFFAKETVVSTDIDRMRR